MRPVIELADALDVARSLLLTALAGQWGRRIFLTDPHDTASPWVRLTRIGGVMDVQVPGAERAQFDVQCFGPTDARTAHQLARAAAAAFAASVGHSAFGGTVTRASMDTGLAWEPDDSRDPPLARWVFTQGLVIRTTQT